MQATNNQTFFDLAMAEAGTMEAAFDMAAAAGMSMTDDPVIGKDYALPASAPVNSEMVKYLKDGEYVPATQSDLETGEIGIGIMAIGSIYKI